MEVKTPSPVIARTLGNVSPSAEISVCIQLLA